MPAPETTPLSAAPESALWKAIYAVYGVYSWTLFALCVPFVLLGAVAMPTLRLRRGAARWIARAFLRLAGMPVAVRGSEHLPDNQCVVVANHASYLDGLVMTAVLPPRFAYVVKREMDRVPLAGLLLRRLGTEFVERFNRHKGATDARRVLRTASGGQSMVFFPEGTFMPQPGVLKFHNGAFATAARAGCPVVPVAVRGTRAIMPCSRVLPRPGRIDVIVLPPLANPVAQGVGIEHAASSLRETARAQIVAASGEPDAG